MTSRRVGISDILGYRSMDDVWSKTVRRLEDALEEYRLLKEKSASEDDPALVEETRQALADSKATLDRKYSQLIAFAAGLSDDLVEFDADLSAAAIVVSRRGAVSYIFGPESVSSSEPFFSPELTQFIADNITSNGPKANDTRPVSIGMNLTKIGENADEFAETIAASSALKSAGALSEPGDTVRLADRIGDFCSGILDVTDNSSIAFMTRSLEFAARIESLRIIPHKEEIGVSNAVPKVDFEYLS
jgi:hypothetical protein